MCICYTCIYNTHNIAIAEVSTYGSLTSRNVEYIGRIYICMNDCKEGNVTNKITHVVVRTEEVKGTEKSDKQNVKRVYVWVYNVYYTEKSSQIKCVHQRKES